MKPPTPPPWKRHSSSHSLFLLLQQLALQHWTKQHPPQEICSAAAQLTKNVDAKDGAQTSMAAMEAGTADADTNANQHSLRAWVVTKTTNAEAVTATQTPTDAATHQKMANNPLLANLSQLKEKIDEIKGLLITFFNAKDIPSDLLEILEQKIIQAEAYLDIITTLTTNKTARAEIKDMKQALTKMETKAEALNILTGKERTKRLIAMQSEHTYAASLFTSLKQRLPTSWYMNEGEPLNINHSYKARRLHSCPSREYPTELTAMPSNESWGLVSRAP